MKTIKTILIALLIIGVAASVGCTDSDGIGTASTDEDLLAGGENVRITLFAGPWREYTDNIGRLIETFTQKYPNVIIDNVGAAGTGDINARIASNNFPELFVIEGYGPIKPFVEYLVDLTEKPIWDEIDETSYTAVTFDGKRYAAPLNVEAYGLVYNKKMFREAGFEQPPKTLSEFKRLCEALKDMGITPVGFGFRESWITSQFLIYPFGWNNDLEGVSREIIEGKTLLKDNYYFKNYKAFVDSCLQYCQPKYLEDDYVTQISLISSEKVAMVSNGDWLGKDIADANPDFEMGMMGIPFTENPEDYKIYVNVSNVMGVFKDSKHPDVGYAFVDWLVTSPEGKKWIGEDWKVNTPVKGTNSIVNPLCIESQQAVADGISGEWGANYLPAEAGTSYYTEFQKYMLGEVSWEQAIDAINEEIVKYGN